MSVLVCLSHSEVDIFEMNGNPLEDSIFGSYHWAKPGKCGDDLEPIPGAGFRPAGAAAGWQTGWHVYAVEWSSERLDFFVVRRTAGTSRSQAPQPPCWCLRSGRSEVPDPHEQRAAGRGAANSADVCDPQPSRRREDLPSARGKQRPNATGQRCFCPSLALGLSNEFSGAVARRTWLRTMAVASP